jgi:multisubunit Na+/H+ antiporter MnhF subunit
VIFRTSVLPNKYALGYAIFTLMIAMYIGVLELAPSPFLRHSALVFNVVTQKLIVLVFCLAIMYQTFGFSSRKDLL